MADLLVVGAGVLGLMVARKWHALYPGASVTLKFRSYNKERAETLGGEGFNVISKEKGENVKAPLVIFCAPPTGNTDYDEDIKLCSQNHWDISEKEKSAFIFTSAGSVYSENSGGVVDEVSETVRNERSVKLLDGEKVVADAGGSNIRLGGLYTLERGPHNFWCSGETTEFSSKPNGLINLIHYDDAAELLVQCLQNPTKIAGETFLVSDSSPISRMDIVKAASSHPKYSACSGSVRFTGGDDVDGKKYNSDKIRNALGWSQKYNSFADFINISKC